MKIIGRILAWTLGLGVLALLALWLALNQSAHSLQARLDQLAASLQVGGSPFILTLPKEGVILVSFRQGDRGPSCAELVIKDGQTRLAHIAGASVPIPFVRGIDLTPWDTALANCNRVTIGLTAGIGFLKGELGFSYQGAQITRLEPAYLWD